MKKIAASQFQAHCLGIIEEVRVTRAVILITKRGRPVAKLVPAGKAPKFLGRLKGIVKIQGDIESPITPADAWTVHY